ncbi:MAG: Ig-like domain-containing protein, partial [Anaerolineae bacterium]|nr:Ig-like domain-containing protein [Anaerolineae bacterium]
TATPTATYTPSETPTATPTATATLTETPTEIPNQPPVIAALENQTMQVNELRDVPFTASDPDGDLMTAFAASNNAALVSVNIPTPGVARLVANAPGTANITITVDDGRGGQASQTFTVTVEQPNRNPIIDPIANQTLNVGAQTDVFLATSDPDGDLLTQLATSDNQAIVTATVTGPGLVHLIANAAGTATITVTVDDGRGGQTSQTFMVTVEQPNQNPIIQPVENQTMAVGEVRQVTYQVSDPDGDAIPNFIALSDNPNTVEASSTALGTANLIARSPGTVTITVGVEDTRGGRANITFAVTVQPGNQNPTIAPPGNATLTVGDTLDVYYTANDPDGDAITVFVAFSDNDAVVAASSPALNTVNLIANGPGAATITINVEDARGGTASATFAVTVTQPDIPPTEPPQPPPGGDIDLNAIPVINQLQGATLTTAQTIYQHGRSMADPGIFSVIGDTPPAQFMRDLGDSEGNFTEIPDAQMVSDVVFYYATKTLPIGGNSFTSGGAVASDPTWKSADLLNPALGNPNACQANEAPLNCELRTNRPSVVFVIVGRNDVIANTPVDQFAANLETILQTTIQNGAIPILMTIPGNPAVYPNLNDYNTTIARAAQDRNLPLINVWRRMNEVGPATWNPADLTLSTSGTGDQFTQAELSIYGVPNRNLLSLRMLVILRRQVPIP